MSALSFCMSTIRLANSYALLIDYCIPLVSTCASGTQLVQRTCTHHLLTVLQDDELVKLKKSLRAVKARERDAVGDAEKQMRDMVNLLKVTVH